MIIIMKPLEIYSIQDEDHSNLTIIINHFSLSIEVDEILFSQFINIVKKVES